MISHTLRFESVSSILALALIFTLSPATHAGIVISELDLAGNRIELVNTGNSTLDISNWWWCNRVNGSPFYSQVSSSTIDGGLSTGTSFLSFAPGEILVVDISGSILPDANGELGIYNTNSFGSASAIEDYILWGANGIRDLVAENAGIWTDNDSIDVSGAGSGDTIQLGTGLPGDQAADYFIGAGSLGVAQFIPEPTTATLLMLAAAGCSRRRRG